MKISQVKRIQKKKQINSMRQYFFVSDVPLNLSKHADWGQLVPLTRHASKESRKRNKIRPHSYFKYIVNIMTQKSYRLGL